MLLHFYIFDEESTGGKSNTIFIFHSPESRRRVAGFCGLFGRQVCRRICDRIQTVSCVYVFFFVVASHFALFLFLFLQHIGNIGLVGKGSRDKKSKRYINGTSNSSKSKCHAADFGFQIVHLNPFHFAFLTPRHGYRGKDKQKKSESKCYKLAGCIQPYRRRHEGKESDWKQAKKRERERESATLRAHPPTVLWSFDLCKIFSNFTQEQRKKKDGNSLPRKRSASKGE